MSKTNLTETLKALKAELEDKTEYEIYEAAVEAFGFVKACDAVEWIADVLNTTAEKAREVEADGEAERIAAPKVLRAWTMPISGNPCMLLELLDGTRVEVVRQAGLGIWAFGDRAGLSREDAGNFDMACDRAWELAQDNGYEARVQALEKEGMTRSDAQGVADAEIMNASRKKE